MPLLVCTFLDGVVDTVGGICTDLIEFELLVVNGVEGDMIGSVFITIEEGDAFPKVDAGVWQLLESE